MATTSSLYEPIAQDLSRVREIFDDELFSDLPLINELCSHVRQYRGKMLRPGLLLLAGRACGKVAEEHLTLAAVVELVHMATLVHDDVLDDADVRRRGPTIHCLEGNEAAVLLGDYLISHAFHLCSSLDSQRASRLIGATTNTVCEGELHQVHHRGNFDLTQEQYLEIITRKTGVLTGACCQLGAIFADAGPEIVAAMERFGLSFGIAFQITDDVLDITGSEEGMGKSLGRDLAKRKLTLPLIHCLAHTGELGRRQLRELLSAHDPDRHAIRCLLDETRSIEYAMTRSGQYVTEAIGCLAMLPVSPAGDALRRMAQMIITRQQ